MTTLDNFFIEATILEEKYTHGSSMEHDFEKDLTYKARSFVHEMPVPSGLVATDVSVNGYLKPTHPLLLEKLGTLIQERQPGHCICGLRRTLTKAPLRSKSDLVQKFAKALEETSA